MTKSTEHNSKLCAEFIARSKVFSRYPRVSEQAESLPFGSGLPKFAYNNSVMRYNCDLWMSFRYHFSNDYRTKIGFALVTESGKIERVQDLELEGFSNEDVRLFMFQSEPWMSWVEAKWEGAMTYPKAVVKFAKLDLPHNDNPYKRRWRVDRIYHTTFGGNDWSSIQKNWCFFEDSDESMLFIYQTWPEQMVYKMSGDKPVTQWNSKGSQWPYGEIRGGTIVPHDGKLLRFFHSSTIYGIGRKEHRYYVGALLMNPEPPFDILVVGKKPILYGSEIDNLPSAERKACRHWKANVVFPCGAVSYNGGWILAAGINDSACGLFKITPDMLNL